jgi:hypothetical protein
LRVSFGASVSPLVGALPTFAEPFAPVARASLPPLSVQQSAATGVGGATLPRWNARLAQDGQ